VRWYGLRAALLAVALCAVPLALASIWLGLVGAAVVSALLVALGWISFLHSERTVLSAVGARLVSEVERPDLYRHVGELARLARLPLPRVYVSPNAQPNILTVGYGPRSAAVCCTEGLLRELNPAELRAVLAHELSHVIRRDVAVSSWSAGVASLVGLSPFNALVLQIAAPSGREYGADTDGALLTGDPMAMASALRKIDTGAAASPLPPRGSLAAAGHLMIAHPFPLAGVGRLLCTHPPTGERVRRLEALAGQGGVLPGRSPSARRARLRSMTWRKISGLSKARDSTMPPWMAAITSTAARRAARALRSLWSLRSLRSLRPAVCRAAASESIHRSK
jgi:heat shock protein HtpX